MIITGRERQHHGREEGLTHDAPHTLASIRSCDP